MLRNIIMIIILRKQIIFSCILRKIINRIVNLDFMLENKNV